MSKHKITRRIPRQPGTQVSYTQAQTDRYKSVGPRILKAQELVDQIQEIPSDRPGRILYFFPSDRAPQGGWVVTINENEPPAPTPPTLPGSPGAAPVSGGGAPPPPTRATVFVAHVGASGLAPGLPPEILRATGRVDYFPPTTPAFTALPWLIGEQFAPGVSPTTAVEATNLIRIIAPQTAEGLTLAQLGGGYWVGNGKLYQPQGFLAILFRYVPRAGEVVPPTYTFDSANRQFRLTGNNQPLIADGFPVNVIAFPLGVDPNNPGGGGAPPDPAAPNQPADPELPLDPGRGHYECNCPDYSRIELQDTASEFPSRWRDRIWIESEAGAPVDDEGRAYCKHVLAAMIRRGEPLPSLP